MPLLHKVLDLYGLLHALPSSFGYGKESQFGCIVLIRCYAFSNNFPPPWIAFKTVSRLSTASTRRNEVVVLTLLTSASASFAIPSKTHIGTGSQTERKVMDAAQWLLGTAPPADLEKNLPLLQSRLASKQPDALSEVNAKYPVPFGVFDEEITTQDAKKGERPFLKCSYNSTDGERYRSPWTNTEFPKPDNDNHDDKANLDPAEEKFRNFEATANEVWDSYKNLYYGHEAVGSVFLLRKAGEGFEGMFGICKRRPGVGSWHSASLVTVEEPGEEVCVYKVVTTVLVVLERKSEGEGSMDISSVTFKETTKELKVNPNIVLASHIENIGTLVESNEMDLRTQLERVEWPKATELIDTLLKDKEQSFRPPGRVNPLMGMIMDSDVLKRKLNKGT